MENRTSLTLERKHKGIVAMWFKPVSIEEVQRFRQRTMLGHLGIEVVEITPHSLIAKMPVDDRTRQPDGILHGGASATLAETAASIAGNLTLDPEKFFAVGLDINTSHLRMVKSGFVTAEAKPIHLGKQTQVWQVPITNDEGKLISYSRLTLMVLERK